MADEVIRLHERAGAPETTLGLVSAILEDVAKGEVRSLAFAAVHRDGAVSTSWHLDIEAGDRLTVIAAIEDLKFSLLARMNGVETCKD